MNADKRRWLIAGSLTRLLFDLRSAACPELCRRALTCGSNLFLFLRGATGLALRPEAPGAYAAHLEHKYSRPTRCC